MDIFFEPLKRIAEYEALLEKVRGKKACVNITGAAEASKAHILAALMKESGKRALVITDNELSAKQFSADLTSFGAGEPARLPPDDLSLVQAESSSFDLSEARLRAIELIIQGETAVVSVPALLCFVSSKSRFEQLTKRVEIGSVFNDFSAELAESGYKRVPEVTARGQFAVRGGIVDVFTPTADNPYRIELFGDEIDGIREFDITTQLSINALKSVQIIPANGDKGDGSIIDYFEDDTIFVIDEPMRVSEAAAAFAKGIEEKIAEHTLKGNALPRYPILDYKSIIKNASGRVLLGFSALSQASPDYAPQATLSFTVKVLPSYSGRINDLAEDVAHWTKKECTLFIMAGSGAHARGIKEALEERELPCALLPPDTPPPDGAAGIYTLSMQKSFEYPHISTLFISGNDIFNLPPKKKRRSSDAGKALRSFDELTPGDYVVHRNHGIGKFLQLCTMEVAGLTRDYLKIAYRDSDVLYVPVNQLNLLYKYSHAGEDAPKPKINRLGGTEWSNTKSKVKGSVKELAFKLIELYAQRSQMQGHEFSKDSLWQSQFEEEFVYEETPDQLRSIEEIKRDMESPRPMDRLLCGDVGYGKTEVAVRAAFKCVLDGLQCAYLVPTTILASQHFNHFIDRMRNYPVKIEMLSRFRTKAQQTAILKKLKSGEIDIIIGTHRLLGDDVEFKNLGLLIVDEEQRFGVGNKEKIKNMKRGIDVLTLTATPIPRTLNMAMTGIRDMSLISIPPEARRPIQTYVMEYDRLVVRDAIAQELSRGGQVYYVYNRVAGIYSAAARLKELMPEAEIAVAHGQMNERELEEIMMKVLEGEIDVLVCTTIIETGIDIPNVNTMIIENADRMGLAQLYQLRGRVGRSSRVAYAYLTFKRDKALSEVAEKRLVAIKEFTELGSGFKIALRDLEIRGAGNILGPEQHGFMASVGYDMYLRLLSETVTELTQNEEPAKTEAVIDISVNARIPEEYIENPKQRLEVYRTIADIDSEDDRSRVIDELIDRFGNPPDETLLLTDVALLRVYAGEAGVCEINGAGEKVVFVFDSKNPPPVECITSVISKYKKKIMFSTGDNPHMTLRLSASDGSRTVEKIKNLLNVMIQYIGNTKKR